MSARKSDVVTKRRQLDQVGREGGVTDEPLAQIEAEILEHEEQLGRLRRCRRGILGGRASATARQRQERNERIRAEYREMSGRYGAETAIAQKYGLTTRQIRRILGEEPAGGTPGRGGQPETRSAPPKLGDVADPGQGAEDAAARIAGTAAPGKQSVYEPLDEAEDQETWTIADLLEEAEGLAGSVCVEADDLMVPGGRPRDLHDVLRDFREDSYELQKVLDKLRKAINARLRRAMKGGGS